MLDVNYLISHKEEVLSSLQKRMVDQEVLQLVDRVIELDTKRKKYQKKLDDGQSEINALSKKIGQMFRDGQAKEKKGVAEANAAKEEVNRLKDSIAEIQEKHKNVKEQIQAYLYEIPNVPHSSVPKGNSEEDNEIFKMGQADLPTGKEGDKPHWELGEDYDLFNFNLGVKITGSGFPVFTGKGAALQRALIAFFLNEGINAGYREIIPPLLVNEDTARGTGQLPDKEGQMYHAEKDNFYLIPTAEVPITNIYRDEIIKAEELPVKMIGYTPCFRREAGSYGADVKGLNRVHQFDKVEIVQIAHPDKSYHQLEEMIAHIEQLLKRLELPYRILRLCGGDLGFTSALTFDFEVFSVAQSRWLEVSSVSNFETFQSNRMKIRFKEGNEKPVLVHTLNGSALALPRIMAALLEINQTARGIRIPECLRPYTGFDLIEKS